MKLSEEENCPVDLEAYITKLNNSKKRVVVVQNILSGAQDRLNKVGRASVPNRNMLLYLIEILLNKVHHNSLKETAKSRTLLEPSPASTPLGEAAARLPK